MSFPQPVPPSWKDLGKSSNDLLGKDYPFNEAKLEVKTTTPSGVVFRVSGNQDSKSGLILGDIEAKYSNKAHGLTLTNTWTTTNTLKSLVEIDNQLAKGLKIDVNASVTPDKGTKGTLLNLIYKQPGVHTRAVLDVFKGPTITADTVFGRDGFLVGAEASYNVTEGRLSRYSAAAGFSAPEYAVTLHGLSNLSTFAVSYYHKVNRDVEAGAKAIYDTKATTSGVSLEVGTKAYLDDAAFVKAKINNAGVLALGYTQSLRPGVRASLGLAIDTQRINSISPAGEVPHKLGANLVFEA
ncbi:eukaryotic porin/Tom40 [Vararia minispora EC-137]|uniref:Eukaryotic porin/Tom40 n=1 Tax=Vararia minispora EC-137 TaxID=1314806 RepID=A0ACB8QXE4_9AGAM|nr:eukaryotic porin/Tom40 [Vararia minispora EC-137]